MAKLPFSLGRRYYETGHQAYGGNWRIQTKRPPHPKWWKNRWYKRQIPPCLPGRSGTGCWRNGCVVTMTQCPASVPSTGEWLGAMPEWGSGWGGNAGGYAQCLSWRSGLSFHQVPIGIISQEGCAQGWMDLSITLLSKVGRSPSGRGGCASTRLLQIFLTPVSFHYSLHYLSLRVEPHVIVLLGSSGISFLASQSPRLALAHLRASQEENLCLQFGQRLRHWVWGTEPGLAVGRFQLLSDLSGVPQTQSVTLTRLFLSLRAQDLVVLIRVCDFQEWHPGC